MLLPCTISIKFTVDQENRAAAVITWLDISGRLLARSGFIHPDQYGVIVIEDAGVRVDDRIKVSVPSLPSA